MSLNVLIVDDSNLDRIMSEMLIRKYLSVDHIVSCSTVDHGLSYLQSAMRFPEKLPVVIFLDVNMPVKDGFDFLDGFLKFPQHIQERCAIFMISATNSLNDMERIKTYPVVRKFFNKPLTFEILDAISEHLDKQKE